MMEGKAPLLTILLAFGVMISHTVEAETWGEVSNDIRFRIWTDKSSYQEGEDVWLYIAFENVGSDARVILVNPQQPQLPDEAPLYDLEEILVTYDNSQRDPLVTIEMVPVASNLFHLVPDLLKISPAEVYQEKTRLTSSFWTDRRVFEQAPFEYVRFTPEPGTYTLQAIYSWDTLPHPTPEREKQLEQLGAPLWQGYLESNQIHFTVSPSTWGPEVNGLRCRLSAGLGRDEWDNVTELVLKIQNTGSMAFRDPKGYVEGRGKGGVPVRGLVHLEIYGVDEEGGFLYHLRLPDVVNFYHAEWSDLVIEPGASYVQVIPLEDTQVTELSRNVLVGSGKLSPGVHTLIAILFGDTLKLQSLPLMFTVNPTTTAVRPCSWGHIKLLFQK